MRPEMLSPQGRAALAFIEACGGVNQALAAILEMRPIVAARQLAALQQVEQRALSTPAESPPAAAPGPNSEDPCPCGSGRTFGECLPTHGAEVEAA